MLRIPLPLFADVFSHGSSIGCWSYRACGDYRVHGGCRARGGYRACGGYSARAGKHAEATEDVEATEDKDVIMAAETLAETMITTSIQNTPALTAN